MKKVPFVHIIKKDKKIVTIVSYYKRRSKRWKMKTR